MAKYRLTYGGGLPGGEIWDSTIHLEDVAGNAGSLITTLGEAVALFWNGPPTPANSITQLVPTTVDLTRIQVDELDNFGKNVAQARDSIALVGTAVADILPYQITSRYTTRSALPTRAGRGGGCPPPFSLDTCVGGLLDSTSQAQLVRATKAMLDHLNAAITGRVGIYHVDHDTITPITSIDVGDVFDNQARRRNQLTETRISATLA